MKKPRWYLCGPIAGCTKEEASGWRDKLKAEYPDIEWVDPVTRDFLPDKTDAPDRAVLVKNIVEGDLADIDSCDGVLLYPFPERSRLVGSSMEVYYAKAIAQKKVITVFAKEHLSPWLEYHSTKVVSNLRTAVDWIRKWSK